MPADLIVYALVAAGLVFWLRSILGTRHGDEPERSNPYMAQPENLQDIDPDNPFIIQQQPMSHEEKIMDLAENPTSVLSVENKTAENGLLDISKRDKNFDIETFLDNAQEAFVIIVEAFAEGDRETLHDLLGDSVYEAFEGAIAAREKAEETQETEIHAIRKAEVIHAEIQDRMALVTIRFVAEETGVTKDSAGEILSGHPDKVTEMRDIWVFGHEIRSRDPRWLVHETRGDFDGDNELLPNTD